MAKPSARLADAQAPHDADYAPYGQLVKMLLPSAGAIALYDADRELLWCSDGYEPPELRALLEETPAIAAGVCRTPGGSPAFIAPLVSPPDPPLGFLVLELKTVQSGTLVASLLKPVVDCLLKRMSLERTLVLGDREGRASLDLLLALDDEPGDTAPLEHLLDQCVRHLRGRAGALVLPDRGIALTRRAQPTAAEEAELLERTQKHLLAWAQLQNRPILVNRVGPKGVGAPCKILSCPVRDPQGRVIGSLGLFRAATAPDFVTEDARVLELVGRRITAVLESHHDRLTGLVNPLIFERRVQRALDAAGGAPTAVLHVDVDRLQQVNDAFGYQAGDEVIRRLADAVRRELRPGDEATRLGGDRLAVFLSRRTPQEAAAAGERILAALAETSYVQGTESVPVSACAGLAISAGAGARIAHLLAAAELACKHAKQAGRGRLETVGDDPEVAGGSRTLAAASLRESLRSNRFRLDAQPVRGLSGKEALLGFEVLVRLQAPDGEVLAPDKFFAAAERYELTAALDRWVLVSLLEALKPHAARFEDGAPRLMVNVSAASLAASGYAEFALERAAQAGVPPGLLCFEVRESVAAAHLAETEAFVKKMRDAGARVALDNFGRGFSSLAYLDRLPVHYLKIDGEFVRRMASDRVAESIVSGIAMAARTLGVETIAQHVETEALAGALRRFEVGYGQGYHFGRPRPLVQALGELAPSAA
ncbi:MAG TPA: GGDEF domain-containing protein [Gammaproteobacteria bacterium]